MQADITKVRVIVKKKPSVLDVEGKTISRSLVELGFVSVVNATKGIVVDLDINTKLLPAGQGLEEAIFAMCSTLLVNDIIESFEYSVL